MTPEEYIQACRECSSPERAMELLRSAENIVAENDKLLAAGRKMKAIIEQNREKISMYSEQVRSLEEQNKTLTEQVGELKAVIKDNRIELMRLGSLSGLIDRLAAVTERLEKTDKPVTRQKTKKTVSEKSGKLKEPFKKYGEYKHVLLTDKQYEKLKADFGGKADEYIQKVDEYCQQVGKTYKDYNLTVRKFIRDDTGGNIPTLPSQEGTEDGFEKFWKIYPRKVGKEKAKKAWDKISPNESLQEVIIAAVKNQKLLPLWSKDYGQYIPYPATWLNDEQWEYEVPKDLIEANTHSYDLDKLLKNAKHNIPRFEEEEENQNV